MIKCSVLCSVLILAIFSVTIHGCYMGTDSRGEHICCNGYAKNIYGECVKHCENCEHGICLSSVCICIHGASKNNTCLSRCDARCKNGFCVDNKCTCSPGFEMKKTPYLIVYDEYGDYTNSGEEFDECKPICDNCANGVCVSANECRCEDGFQKTATGCTASCDDCSNGVCVGPNQCKCFPGYYQNSEKKCVPHCHGNCPQEKCVSPGVCKCEEGFKWSYFIEQCIAECAYTPCKGLNEQCAKLTTGKCECKAGFKRNPTNNQCEPVCENTCVNGFCSAPNVCSCNEKFTHKNSTYCEPKCDPMCPSKSSCQPDGTCKCDDGFKEFLHICIKECKNGYSDLYNGCKCFPGFVLNPKNGSECLTDCQLNGCENGFCSQDGKECICNLHYKKDNSTGKCVKCEQGTVCNGEFVPFECDPPCKHGLCIQKNVCACHAGFDKTEESHICEPVCSGGCANGVCHSPQNCTCNEGYEKVDKKCQPVCEHQCINGFCSAPNVCNCTEGHEFVHSSKHKCEKIKCHHGEHHKGHKDCPHENGLPNKEASSGIPDNDSGISTWVIVSLMGIAVIMASAFGVIWYLKTTRNASFPLIENFVYNRMTE